MRTDVLLFKNYLSFSSVQSLSHVQLFATPWIAAHQASLSITNSQSSPKLMSIESVIPSLDFIIFKKGILAYEWLTFTFTFACDWNLNFVKGMKSSRTHPHPLFKDDNSFSGKQCVCVCVTNGIILCWTLPFRLNSISWKSSHVSKIDLTHSFWRILIITL